MPNSTTSQHLQSRSRALISMITIHCFSTKRNCLSTIFTNLTRRTGISVRSALTQCIVRPHRGYLGLLERVGAGIAGIVDGRKAASEVCLGASRVHGYVFASMGLWVSVCLPVSRTKRGRATL